MPANRQQNEESGMAMVLVITILAALLGIAAVGLSLQLNSTKSTTLIKESREALFCAEAGLAAGRNVITSNRSDWTDVLAGNAVSWYSNTDPKGFTGDADNDGVGGDYWVTIEDDGDDADKATDINDTIIVTSSCVLFPNSPASVIEVISLRGQGHAYRSQSGQGSGNTGNAN